MQTHEQTSTDIQTPTQAHIDPYIQLHKHTHIETEILTPKHILAYTQ